MSTYIDKPLSLIERKKQQWAREREELASLSVPWSFVSEEYTRIRNVKLASAEQRELYSRRGSNASYNQNLPPIYKNQAQIYIPNDRTDKEMGGETSGYGSDNPNNTPEYFQQTTWNQNLGYESSSSTRDDRAKWGDRGVGVGKFWNQQEARYNTEINDAPGWVKRGLQGETELIVSNTSPAESPEQDYGDQRPYTSSSISQTRTYIRGQNNPVDPVELAERERKRQLARAHQEAIKQQLEERERKRKEEKERQMREEKDEELRIEREREIEKQRRDREVQALKEKQERERKRKEALQEAIQLAEKEAKEEKLKQKVMKQNINISENVIEKEKLTSPRPIGEETVKLKNNLSCVHKNDEINFTEEQEKSKPNNVSYISNPTSNNNTVHNKINEKKENNINRNRSVTPTENPSVPIMQPVTASPSSLTARSNIQENITMMVQTPFEHFQSIPFAVLMPTFNAGTTTSLPVAVSVPVNTDPLPRSRTENRLLTPTQYRNRRFCESGTQTDSDNARDIKYIGEKLTNLDVGYEGRSRKESRSRTSERSRDNTISRPKWGVNRPPTRYLKQSEKDPFYQRKKTRQKIRQVKLYDDKNNNYSPHSSDESQAASPRLYRPKEYVEKRRTRALWQKNEQLKVYQTEIVPLLSDKDQIYYKKSECIKCCCECRSQKHRYPEDHKTVDILKIDHTPMQDPLPEFNISSVDNEVLEKLNSLQNGLIIKQEQWQNSSRSPSEIN